MKDSKKQRIYDTLSFWFLTLVDLHLHIKIKAAVPPTWVIQKTVTNNGANEGKVRATVVRTIPRVQPEPSLWLV
jgi:hypothetical protein